MSFSPTQSQPISCKGYYSPVKGDSLSPMVCYVFNKKSNSICFPNFSDHLEKCSLLPSCNINGKKVFFTYRCSNYVVYYDGEFIESSNEIFNKISLTSNLNSEVLDKIALVVNFLSEGKNYEYIPNSANYKEKNLWFNAKKGTNTYKVNYSLETDHVHYQLDSP